MLIYYLQNFLPKFFEAFENLVRKPAKFIITVAPLSHSFIRKFHRTMKKASFFWFKKYEFRLSSQECLEKTKLIESSSLLIKQPSFLPVELGKKISNHSFLMTHPGVFLIKYKDVGVLAGFHLVFDQSLRLAFHDIFYNPTRHALAGEKQLPTYFSNQSTIGLQTVSIKIESEQPIVSLFGDANGNFYHFMLETATRAAVVSDLKQFSYATFLIEKNLPPNMYIILKALLPKTSKLKTCERFGTLRCKELFYVTLPGFCPSEDRAYFEEKVLNTPHPEGVTVNLHALRLLKDKLYRSVLDKTSIDNRHNFKKIYLIRNSPHRKLRNQKRIIQIAKDKGFLIVNPEKFAWHELFYMCASAEHIIIEAGAAMLNLIFAKKTTSVLILSPFIIQSTYSVHHNVIEASGLSSTFLIGSTVKGTVDQGVHMDFEIDERVFDKKISTY